MTTLELNGLTKRYGDFLAVDDVSLTLRDGEFLSLLGPSGCGKTTTLRMIAGFITPSEGSIRLDETEISSPSGVVPPERRQMSMIFQSYAIWPNMTVAENVGFGLRMKKLPKAEQTKQVDKMLEIVQLGHLAGRYPSELSGGQQQRVAMARAVAARPKVMLLDEPLSNLDANLREEMRSEIKRMHTEFGVTTVYVTHDQSEAMAISDRIAVIRAGRVEQLATPFELYARPRTRFSAAFIGRTNLVESRREADRMTFLGCSIPATGDARDSLVSIRPQNVALTARAGNAPPDRPGHIHLEAEIAERIYLGERWDYGLSLPGRDDRLRAAAPPEQTLEVGQPVWVEIPIDRVVPVQDREEMSS